MSTLSFISSVVWAPPGVAQQFPKKYTVDEAELERVQELAKGRLDDARFDLEEFMQGNKDAETSGSEEDAMDVDMDDEAKARESAKAFAKTIKTNQAVGEAGAAEEDEVVKAYNLDDYDNEKSTSIAMGAFSKVQGLSYYAGVDEEDPYITMEAIKEDEDEERQELEILPTDNLLCVAKTLDDIPQLEVYVYDEKEENIYVHHDMLLPALPLCLEWLDFCPGKADSKPGNYIAVGTTNPEIEIWSLDVVDGLYPDAILGGASGSTEEEKKASKKNKKKSKKTAAPPKSTTGHTAEVLSISWNKQHRNFLASASADKTIKIWDLSRPTGSIGECVRSFDSIHNDKIQSVSWNPTDPTVLLSGSWDRSICVFDARSTAPEGVLKAVVASDVECVKWDPHSPTSFLVSLDNGIVQEYDSRNLKKPLWTLAAHDSSVSSLDIHPSIKGFMVTGGYDNQVKLWNISEVDSKPNISMIASRDLGVGKVFASSFCIGDPSTIAVAGSNASIQLWDTSSNHGVRAAYGEKLTLLGKDLTKGGDGVIGLINDAESDMSDDE